MGYEVNYKYYDRLKDSFEYDRDNQKNFKKVYGKATEEYPLDKLYQALMQQLARRDILIVEWEIFEFVRKKINSRITKNDLVIGSRKFNMKNVVLENLEESEFEENNTCQVACHAPVEKVMASIPSPPPVQHNPAAPAINIAASPNKHVNLAPVPVSNRIIKQVQFLPGRITQPIGKFTVEKVYPVFSESFAANGIGMILETQDDTGRRVKVPDEYFVPCQQSLIGDEEARFSQTSRNFVDDSKLDWGGAIKESVPKLR
jgi:hypothetical protein